MKLEQNEDGKEGRIHLTIYLFIYLKKEYKAVAKEKEKSCYELIWESKYFETLKGFIFFGGSLETVSSAL